MESWDLVEVIVVLVALLFAGIKWLFRKLRGSPPSRSTPSLPPPPSSRVASPGIPPKGRIIPAVVLATLVAVLLGALIASLWASFRPGASPELQETLGYLTAFYLCVGAPVIAALAVWFTSALSTFLSEFQGRPLTRSLRAAIGALLGLALTIPVFLLVASE